MEVITLAVIITRRGEVIPEGVSLKIRKVVTCHEISNTSEIEVVYSERGSIHLINFDIFRTFCKIKKEYGKFKLWSLWKMLRSH